jgi:hypothetical protein
MKKFIIAFLTTPLLISTLISPAKANGIDLTHVFYQNQLCSNTGIVYLNLQQYTLAEMLAIDVDNYHGLTYSFQLLDGSTEIDEPLSQTSDDIDSLASRRMRLDSDFLDDVRNSADLKMRVTTTALDSDGNAGDSETRIYDVVDIYDENTFEGTGTAEDPYLVGTPEQFNALRCLDWDDRSRDAFEFIHVEIIADLDMGEESGVYGLIPMSVIKMKLEGNNHKISNVRTFGYRDGLFAATTDSSYKNLRLDNFEINGGIQVGIFGNYCNRVEFENIQITNTVINSLNGGTFCHNIDRSSFKNVEVESAFDILAESINKEDFQADLPSMPFLGGTGGIGGRISATNFDNVRIDFEVKSGMGNRQHSSGVLANNLISLKDVGGLFGRSIEEVNVENATVDLNLSFAGAAQAHHIGGLAGNPINTLVQNAKVVASISLSNPVTPFEDSLPEIYAIGGIMGLKGTSSILGSSVTGAINITSQSSPSDLRVGAIGSVWGDTDDGLTVQRVRADLDISVAAPNVSGVGAIGGRWRDLWLKDVVAHSDLSVTTTGNGCDEFGVGAFSGIDDGLGKAEQVITTGDFAVNTSCSKADLSTTFGYSRSGGIVFWSNSYWNSSTDSDLGTRTDPANGVGATTNQLKTRKFFNAKEYDFKKIWTMDSKTGFATLRPNKGYTSTALKAQSSKQGLIGFSNLASDSRRTYKINLPSSDAGKSATIRLRGTGSAKSLKQVKLNRQGDATFKSNVTLNVGDLLQLVVDKKVRVKLLLK